MNGLSHGCYLPAPGIKNKEEKITYSILEAWYKRNDGRSLSDTVKANLNWLCQEHLITKLKMAEKRIEN